MLVADSYDGPRQACARYLGDFHFRVAQAANGEEALAVIGATLPHLVLTEWTLPLMPASRLMQWLAQSWRTRGIPIIVLARATESHRVSHRAAGVLVRPFSPLQMLEEVRRVLRRFAPTS